VTVRRRFAAKPDSVAGSRLFAAEQCADLAQEIREAIVLMVSELATNAVVHAVSGFDVLIDRSSAQVRVSVTDEGRGVPMLHTPEIDEPHGRGLRVVQALSHRWGTIEQTGGLGKSVWFTIDLSGSVDADFRASQQSGRPLEDQPRTGSAERSTPTTGAERSAEDGRKTEALSATPPPGPRQSGVRGLSRYRLHRCRVHVWLLRALQPDGVVVASKGTERFCDVVLLHRHELQHRMAAGSTSEMLRRGGKTAVAVVSGMNRNTGIKAEGQAIAGIQLMD
jgi:hypothetical protein